MDRQVQPHRVDGKVRTYNLRARVDARPKSREKAGSGEKVGCQSPMAPALFPGQPSEPWLSEPLQAALPCMPRFLGRAPAFLCAARSPGRSVVLSRPICKGPGSWESLTASRPGRAGRLLGVDRTAGAKVFYITPDGHPCSVFAVAGKSSGEWRGRRGLLLGDRENGQVDR